MGLADAPRKGRVLLGHLHVPDTNKVAETRAAFRNAAQLAKSFCGLLDLEAGLLGMFTGSSGAHKLYKCCF